MSDRFVWDLGDVVVLTKQAHGEPSVETLAFVDVTGEERDDHGRWTSGSGSSSPETSSRQDAAAIKEMTKSIREAGVHRTDIKSLDVDVAKDCTEAIVRVLNAHPTLARSISMIKATNFLTDPDVPASMKGSSASMQFDFFTQKNKLYLNTQIMKKEARADFERAAEIGFSAHGSGPFSGIIEHELGHGAYNRMIQSPSGKKAAEAFQAAHAGEMEAISKYAKTNDAEAWAETYARSFGPNPPPVAKALAELIDKRVGGKK